MAVLVGPNASGESTLFDVFSFLKDALVENVGAALARRGGFRELVSRGESEPIVSPPETAKNALNSPFQKENVRA